MSRDSYLCLVFSNSGLQFAKLNSHFFLELIRVSLIQLLAIKDVWQ